MKSETDCYGKMFPRVIEMAHNNSVTGKVFGYRVDYLGQVDQPGRNRKSRGVAAVFGVP